MGPFQRVEFLRDWLENGQPKAYWISGFSFPQGFLTGVLQTHARRFHVPIDLLRFRCEVCALFFCPCGRTLDTDHPLFLQVLQVEDPTDLKAGPDTGVYIYGMFMDGARWDRTLGCIEESRPGELYTTMPVIWLEPETMDKPVPANLYTCPGYKTSTRAGVLSTTGLSTNFISNFEIPSGDRNPDHWTQRGVAMLSMLDT